MDRKKVDYVKEHPVYHMVDTLMRMPGPMGGMIHSNIWMIINIGEDGQRTTTIDQWPTDLANLFHII
jgi:hypothetical protein